MNLKLLTILFMLLSQHVKILYARYNLCYINSIENIILWYYKGDQLLWKSTLYLFIALITHLRDDTVTTNKLKGNVSKDHSLIKH